MAVQDDTTATPSTPSTAEVPASTGVPPYTPPSRRVPRWSDLRPLLRFERVEPRPARRRLARAATIADLREAARHRVPRSVFEFVDGAAEDELTLARNRAAFDRVEFAPRMLRGVSSVDTATTVAGHPSALPLVLAPTGFARLSHHEGERAVARAAAAAGIPFTLTTTGTTSIEDVAAAGGPAAQRWFQLYLLRDGGLARDLVDRASAAGYSALAVTVDTPVPGQRRRDGRNGFSVPPKLTARTIADIARRPSWWANLLTTDPLEFATLPAGEPAALASYVESMFDPGISYADLARIRDAWSGPLYLKGVTTLDDARRARDAGADGVILSNHGGRQLDRAPVPLEVLPAVADALGDELEIYLDSGVRTGADVAAAVALGARAVLVGRPYLYGLQAGGEEGVAKAIDILASELRRTMHLLGVGSVAALDRSSARLR